MIMIIIIVIIIIGRRRRRRRISILFVIQGKSKGKKNHEIQTHE